MGGGFHSAPNFAPAPRTFNAPPQYHWNMPVRSTGSSQARLPNANWHNPPAPDWHQGQHRPYYPNSRYRRPYVPYFYANSTYLVPGLLNSTWDYQDGFNVNDESASTAQSQDQNNGSYDQESQPDYGDQEQRAAYQTQDVPPPPPGSVEPLPQAAVTLVFKDGHSQQVRNYAVTRTTLYVLDDAASGRRPEIPLNQIDVSATEKTNREAGMDFSVPTGN
jgi:hypothetical protein